MNKEYKPVIGPDEVQPGEVEVWCFAVGNMPGPFASRKLRRAHKKAMDIICHLDGMIGIHPMPPRGNLIVFLTENDAKAGKNILRSKDIQTGDHIAKVYVPADLAKQGYRQMEIWRATH